MLATNRLVETRTRRLLQERYATTLPRFDLMAQLERAPKGLKMGELSKRMMVTGGNVTGITDLLEREGLVERVADPRDRARARAADGRGQARVRGDGRGARALDRRGFHGAVGPRDGDDRGAARAAQGARPITRGRGMKTEIPDLTATRRSTSCGASRTASAI
jgi:hypothetical protein